MLALFAISLIAALSPAVASARGGFGGGGFRGGGGVFTAALGGGGFRGGVFLSRGFASGRSWRGRRLAGGAAYGAVGVGLGLGLVGNYYDYPYGYEFDYPYGYGEYAEYGPWAYSHYYGGACYLAGQRVWAAHRWRLRAVRVCD
jgi:hypothetical protein